MSEYIIEVLHRIVLILPAFLFGFTIGKITDRKNNDD